MTSTETGRRHASSPAISLGSRKNISLASIMYRRTAAATAAAVGLVKYVRKPWT